MFCDKNFLSTCYIKKIVLLLSLGGDILAIITFLISLINNVSNAIGYLLKYKTLYKIIGFFTTRKFKPAKKNHKYAILIAARNEETVIGNLIESILIQDYPHDLITTFVVADNSTDNTAKISREMGAICYERTDTEHRTKGYALQFLVEQIRRDYGIESFEGYFIFDADNLLEPDYVSRMNDSFDAGEKIITSYRNTKNFDANWIAASYGIHWLRTVRNEHRARSLCRLATRIQGTGFLFASETIKDGWNYTSFTEDRAFCADAVVNGYRISYNHDAIFYDEQPENFKIALRQRIRWSKGHLQAFGESGWPLFKQIFTKNNASNEFCDDNIPKWKKILYDIRFRFMTFDMLSVIYPRSLFIFFKRIVIFWLRATAFLAFTQILAGALYPPDIFSNLFSWFDPSTASSGSVLGMMTLVAVSWSLNTWLNNTLTAAYIFFVERKRIKHIKWYKKLYFCLMFNIFDIIGRLTMVAALFMKVEWKPIPHKSDVKIADLVHK